MLAQSMSEAQGRSSWPAQPQACVRPGPASCLVVRGDMASAYHADVRDKLQFEADNLCKTRVQVSSTCSHWALHMSRLQCSCQASFECSSCACWHRIT